MAIGISQVQTGGRQYPGEEAANRFFAYLRPDERGSKRRAKRLGIEWRSDFAESSHSQSYPALLTGLKRVEAEYQRKGSERFRGLSKRSREALEEFEHELYDHALAVNPWALDWNARQGFVVAAASDRIHALLALLELLKRRALNRIRQCQHCGSWFYARFKHQVFCNEPNKKCQWSHYHTPEWRKKNRERNRVHQRQFRERLFRKGEKS